MSDHKPDRTKQKTHLKPWKPGQSGNPKGRPRKGETLTEILREQGEIADVAHKGEQIKRKVALGHKTWAIALAGSEATIRYLYDRIDGKPTQEIKVNGNAKIDAPIHLHIGGQIQAIEDDEEPADTDEDGD